MLVRSQPGRMKDWTIALVAAWAVSAIILLGSNLFHRLLKERGLIAIERLMGMLLVTLSVQMFLDGVAKYLSHHAIIALLGFSFAETL